MEFKHVYITKNKWKPMRFNNDGSSMFVSIHNESYLQWLRDGNTPEEIPWDEYRPVSYDDWEEVRDIRDQLLKDSDWTQLPDVSLSDEDKFKWTEYRKSLRNIPQVYDNVDSIIWPTI